MSGWLIILFVMAFAYILANFVLYLIQDKFIFHAEKLPKNHKFILNRDFDEVNIESDDGEVLNAIHVKFDVPSGVIIYFHNRSENLNDLSEVITLLSNFNYDILAMDYRGFGKSSGNYNDKLMFNDAQLWYDYVVDNYDESSIVVYGQGIGSSFAASVTANNNPSQLILEAPIYNLVNSAKFQYPYLPYKLLLKYDLDTAFYFKNITCKTTIFHGLKDKIESFNSSQMLYDISNKEITELILLEDANHFSIIIQHKFTTKISEILA